MHLKTSMGSYLLRYPYFNGAERELIVHFIALDSIVVCPGSGGGGGGGELKELKHPPQLWHNG